MKKRIVVVALMLCTCYCAANRADWNLLPRPQKMELMEGDGPAITDIRFVSGMNTEVPVLFGLLDRLPRKECNGVGVYLSLDTTSTPSNDEGYVLEVTQKRIDIQARTAAGIFYGCTTLAQLIEEATETQRTLPAVRITDWPDLSFRAVHFDTKHHLDRMEYYYTLVDRLASWKVNAIIWEVEDKLRYERHPECAAPNAISKQEMAALCRYAKERNIEVNPLVQGLGHAGFFLKRHWELRENPASDWECCPSNPHYYDLQFDLYKDAMEAMPYGHFLHVGGDEVSGIGNDALCKSTGKTPFELQMMWLKKVCDFAKAHGRTAIFWDDMPLKYANVWRILNGKLSDEEVERKWNTDSLDDAITLFPPECIYMRWYYDNPDFLAQRKLLEWYKEKGLPVMGATAAADGGSPFMPRYGSKTEHIRNFCQLAEKNKLGGIFATCWDDGSPHWETVMRGFAALGEWGWNSKGCAISEFKQAFSRRFYGLEEDGTSFIEHLERAAFFFDGALVKSGRRNPAWQVTNYKLIDMPDKTKPGKWSKAHAALLDSARQQLALCASLQSELDEAWHQALRNRYAIEVYAQNNALFAFPAQVLLAVNAIDMAKTESEKRDAKERISGLYAEFNTLRANLLNTYSKTRFMQLPNGYVEDQNNHHHLSALAPDDSWIYLYEKAFLDALSQWMKSKPKKASQPL